MCSMKALKTIWMMNTAQQEGPFKIRLFCLFIFYQARQGCPPAGSRTFQLELQMTSTYPVTTSGLWIITLHSVIIPSCYKTNIKNWNLQVNLHLWSQYKKHFFNSFYLFLEDTQNKTPRRDVSTLLLLSYSEGAFSFYSCFFQQRGSTFFSSRQLGGGGGMFPSFDNQLDVPGWRNMHPLRSIRLQTHPSSSPHLPHHCPPTGCC